MSGCCERPAEAAGRVAVAEEPECPLREAMISSVAVARSTTVNGSGRLGGRNKGRASETRVNGVW